MANVQFDEPNRALWLTERSGRFKVGPAAYTAAGPDEVVIRARAVAVNPVDAMPGLGYRLVLPWVRFPAIIGNDVAGEVVEVGSNVTRLRQGERVVAHAMGLERSRNRPAEGAFQRYIVLMAHMVSAIPDTLSYAQAAVLPLGLSTAASGMFGHDHLGLTLPTVSAPQRDGAVLVWGGSTSVGSNAIQLARSAGYEVLATASPHNFDYVRSLGASEAFDYRSPSAVAEVIDAVGDRPLTGALAIGSRSLSATLAIASKVAGHPRVATAQRTPADQVRARWQRLGGNHVSLIWGGSLKDDQVGPAIYSEFLPAALANGTYRAAPDAVIVGQGLESIPKAIDQLRAGVSASKLVVSI